MAKVLSFEDNEDWKFLNRIYVGRTGHELIGEAGDVFSAKNLIAKMAAQAHIAIVDGDLGVSKNDGAFVVQGLLAINPNIITIGNSLDRDVLGAQFQAQKRDDVLRDILNGLK